MNVKVFDVPLEKRSDSEYGDAFLYYVGGRTAIGISPADEKHMYVSEPQSSCVCSCNSSPLFSTVWYL